MAKRLLVTEAGTGPSEHLIRSLRDGDDGFSVAGCHSDQFLLRSSAGDRRFVVPRASHARYAAVVQRIVEREPIDLVVPNADDSVAALSAARDRFPRALFLPGHDVIRLCQDKYALTRRLARHGVPVPRTHALKHLDDVRSIFRRLGSPDTAWCRIRAGAMSYGAAPVRDPQQARRWIRFWTEMRGVPVRAFTVSEYLPGRDFACLMLWKDGTLILARTCERLSYFFGGSQPSGRSSMAALGKTVREPRVVEVCAQAIRALDPRASGVFSIDLRGDARGEPCITEINAGRLVAMVLLCDRTGTHSLTRTYARLALGEPVDVREEYDAPEDYYFVRSVDAEPLVFHASEFFDGIDDARAAPGSPAAGVAPAPAADGPKRAFRHRLQIPGRHDRHSLEALFLTIRREVERAGLAIERFDIADAHGRPSRGPTSTDPSPPRRKRHHEQQSAGDDAPCIRGDRRGDR